ncbi:EF-hand domain-containing protein [Roseomonas sp. CCTCC AB2023176]|uniref:EF-hand domain-containing protein n=1 Tax=Roseomonas sp. CCTCC AB2023176 TaxID=3342640 RepID=UPI0035E25CCC
MTRTRKIIAATLIGTAALGAGVAIAQTRPHHHRAAMGEQMFNEADANRDGRITQEEGWAALSARFARADANGDGGVTWEEFRTYVQAQMQAAGRPMPAADRAGRMEERGQAMFRALDSDRDGKVTLAELRPFAEAMFRMRDTNGDGALTREELRPRGPRGDRPAPGQPAPAQPAR